MSRLLLHPQPLLLRLPLLTAREQPQNIQPLHWTVNTLRHAGIIHSAALKGVSPLHEWLQQVFFMHCNVHAAQGNLFSAE